MAKAPINVTITGDYNDRDIKRAIRDLRSLQGDAGQTTQTMGLTGKAGVALGAAIAAGAATAGYAIVRFGKDSIMAASDFEEVQNKVQEVFGPAGRQVLNDFAETADTAMGLSRTAFLDASSQFGIFGRAAGLAGRDLVTFSSDLTQLSGDLASFNNTTVDEAIQALGAGLRGESEPLRRFGILLDDATLKARAMELGIYDGTGSLSQQQRVLAAQAEILAQTNVQQGDFGRTADGLANTMRTLSAAVENAQIEIGKGFVAAIQQVSSDMGGPSGLAARIEDLGRQISNMTRGIGFLIGKFKELTDESDGTYNPLQSLVRIFQAIEAASPIQGIVRLAGQIGILGDATRDYIAEGSAMEAALRAQSALLRARSRDEQVNLDGLSAATDRYTGLAKSLGAEIGWGTKGLQSYNAYLEELEKRTKAAGKSTKDAKDEVALLRKQFGEPLADKALEFLDKLKDRASTLKDEFMSFYESIRSNVNSTLTFAGALEEMNNARDRFTQTQERVATATERVNSAVAAESEARARYNEVMADSNAKASERESVQNALNNAIKNTATATRDLTTAQQDDAKAADEAGKTYLQRLQEQAGAAQKFLETITTLYSMGLRGEALKQIGEMSATAGVTAGEQLIAGGETAIQESMRLVDATNTAAAKVAELTAVGFIGTGAITAENTVKGFEDVMGDEGTGRKKLMRIMDRLAADMRRETTVTVTTIHRSVFESVGLPGRAMGGPVSASQAYVVGERGPEVFVPDVAGTIVPNHAVMSPARGGIGGGGINLTVNAGMGTDGAEVGRQIVDALRQYQRRNGPVPILVA